MELSRTAYVILGILGFEDSQSGYDIRKTIEGSVGFFWGESYGQIYPSLKRLAAEGLITAGAPDPSKKSRRQEYCITPAGRASLREWLAVPFRHDPPRDEFLLKLFFGVEADPGVALGHIRDFQEQQRQLLASFEQLEGLARERNAHMPGFPYWMLTLSFGLSQLRAALEWSETAMAQLTAAGEARGRTEAQDQAAEPGLP
jgi:DNA-binding PadR family transcriptional regulator